jgi:hypothetical protein
MVVRGLMEVQIDAVWQRIVGSPGKTCAAPTLHYPLKCAGSSIEIFRDNKSRHGPMRRIGINNWFNFRR